MRRGTDQNTEGQRGGLRDPHVCAPNAKVRAVRRYGTRTSYPIAQLQGEPVSIRWNDDIDNVLRDASGSDRPILLDFSAAPM